MDLLGVGIGPFNLSLAALLSPLSKINSIFFDSHESFSWHPGMMLPGAEIQVTHLKDLVTLADPTNPYSFIAYLARHKRLYRFIRAEFKYVLRQEFNDYMRWVSESLGNLHFAEPVLEIHFTPSGFITRTKKANYHSQHLVLANGLTPVVPAFVKKYLGTKVFHSSQYLPHKQCVKAKRIAVIGGGQSAAEIVANLLSHDDDLPASLSWVTSRTNILPMDDSAFTSEIYGPSYSQYFHSLSQEKRARLLREQVLSSDGVSQQLIAAIYQRLYVLDNLQQAPVHFSLFTDVMLTEVKESCQHYELSLSEGAGINADIIILCTGYSWEFPEYLAPLKERIPLVDDHFNVGKDYSIEWNGPRTNRIYVQNAATHSHGIADRNLSLMAFRSATIINSIAGKTVYDIENETACVEWGKVSNG